MDEIKREILAPGIISYNDVGENISNMIPEWEQNIQDGWIAWQPAEVGSNIKRMPEKRDLNTFSVSSETGNPVINKIRENLDNTYKLYVEDYCKFYRTNTNESDAYTILKYEKGHHYVEHMDRGPGNMSQRNISFIHYLNDDYEGGKIIFVHFNLKIKPKKGQLIIFPSNYPYLHSIEPVISGERWAITKFLY